MASGRCRRISAARRLIAQARHAAESAREARYREIVRTTIEAIVAQAGIGRIDALKAREILKEVEDAVASGQPVDVQKLVSERMSISWCVVCSAGCQLER